MAALLRAKGTGEGGGGRARGRSAASRGVVRNVPTLPAVAAPPARARSGTAWIGDDLRGARRAWGDAAQSRAIPPQQVLERVDTE
jgi:hypothetical protein